MKIKELVNNTTSMTHSDAEVEFAVKNLYLDNDGNISKLESVTILHDLIIGKISQSFDLNSDNEIDLFTGTVNELNRDYFKSFKFPDNIFIQNPFTSKL